MFACDVSSERAVATLGKAVVKRFGSVDVLINNAGSFAGAPLTKMSVADFDRMIAANLRSVFLVSRAFLPAMIAQRRGDVFNMSSIAGRIAYPGGTGYSSAKFGVSGLSQVMRAELRDQGVRVCCVYPGATVSPSWAGSGVPEERLHFLDMPFYETGRVRKKPLGAEDIEIVKTLLRGVKPHLVYAAGDLSDPHGTHRVCLAAIFRALRECAACGCWRCACTHVNDAARLDCALCGTSK